MKTVIVSCSQNKTRGKDSNSTKTGQVVKELLIAKEGVEEIKMVELSKYQFHPCTLCGACKEKHTCVMDEEFAKAFQELKGKDLILGIVPYYSPIPSSVSILLEKFNQIMVSAHLSKNPLKENIKDKKVGLIVHGGMVENPQVIEHYQQILARPLIQTLKSLGFQVLQNERFTYGFAFGLENEQAVVEVKEDLFPSINHRKEYLKTKVRPYIDFLCKNL